MKKNKKIILIIVGLIGLIIIIFCIIHPSVLRTPPLSRGGENTNTENTNLFQPSLVKVEVNTKKESQIVPKALSVKNIKISLFVLDKKYETEIKENSSVFEVMKKIEEESTENNLFNFEYTEYSSLGSFITEINDIKSTSGKYWIYYVNNTEASVGVSKYILKDGDSILWKQE